LKNPFLAGKKVYLRPLEPSDAPRMVGWMNDPDVRRTLGIARPLSEQSEQDFIDKVTRNPNEVGFAIVARRDDRFIGTAGLMQIDWFARLAGFGISIGDTSRWGLGYGTETTRLVTDYAFDTLNLNRVWLHVYDINPAGIRVYERVGYRREGLLRQGAYRDGAYRDVLAMAILREDWQAARTRPGRASAAPGRSRPATKTRARRSR